MPSGDIARTERSLTVLPRLSGRSGARAGHIECRTDGNGRIDVAYVVRLFNPLPHFSPGPAEVDAAGLSGGFAATGEPIVS